MEQLSLRKSRGSQNQEVGRLVLLDSYLLVVLRNIAVALLLCHFCMCLLGDTPVANTDVVSTMTVAAS